MSINERELATLCDEIETFLAQARRPRPLQQAAPLLDLDQLSAGREGVALIAHLGAALEGWSGQLHLRVADDALAPTVQAGDRLTIDPEGTSREGDLVVAFFDGALQLRRLARHAGRQALVGGNDTPRPLGPDVALLGPVIELRRWLAAG